MKYSFFILVLLGLSCQKKTAEQNSAKDTTAVVSPTNPTPPSSPAVQESVPSTYRIETEIDFNAVLLPGAQIYSDSTNESQVVMETKGLTPTQTNTTSTSAPTGGGDICSQYFWHNVSMGVGKGDGWVYGDNLLQAFETAPYTPLEIAGTPYKLYYFTDSGVGPSNKDGLTGCNQYYIPYLWNNEKGTMRFIQDNSLSFPGNSFTTSFGGYGWLGFISSEGGSAVIQSIEYTKSESSFHLFLNVGYQDGGSKFHMIVVEREGDLVLQSLDEVNED